MCALVINWVKIVSNAVGQENKKRRVRVDSMTMGNAVLADEWAASQEKNEYHVKNTTKRSVWNTGPVNEILINVISYLPPGQRQHTPPSPRRPDFMTSLK